jgi:hypothetical protein
MKPRAVFADTFVRIGTPPEPGEGSRRSPQLGVRNLRPLNVPDLAERFGKSAYTIREWAKKGKLTGAKRVGRDWAFPLDVDYSDDARSVTAPMVQLAVKEALEQLNRYPVGAARAA